MASVVRLVLLGLLAGLALLGLALGAETQHESVLESDLEAQGDEANQGAAGNLVALTAVLVAIGVTGCLLLLSRLPVLRRLLPALGTFVATYGGVLLGQTMWPAYFAVLEQRSAILTTSLLAANLRGTPSAALIPLTLMLAAFLTVGACATRLLGHPPHGRGTPAARLLRHQSAAVLLAAPFLAVVAWGNLRLLLGLPDDRPGLGPYFVVLPALTLCCLALLALGVAKTWQLGTYVRNARLGAAVQEAWLTLGRVEAALLAVLAALALAGTVLPKAELADVALGRVLILSLRAHTQSTVLLAIPLLPLLLVNRFVARDLADAPLHPATLDDATDPVARGTLVAAACTVGLAAVGTWLLPAALWTWLLAVLPAAGLVAWRCGARLAAPLALLAAFVLWAIGNTVEAAYDAREGTALLSFVTPPGVLAFWRTLGAVLAAATLARLAHGLGPARFARLPLAAGAGAALAAVALLEMPLTAWLPTRSGDAIAVGSVVASLDPPVRAIVHTVALVLAVTAAVLVALLHRPDWFQRPPQRPLALVRPKRVGKDPGKTPA